jgi:hypothetical protein
MNGKITGTNSFTLAFGIIFCAAILLFSEVSLRVCDVGGRGFERHYSANYSTINEFGVINPRPGRHQSFELSRKSGKVII